MDKVGGSFGIFYGYVGIVGLVLFLVLRWFKAGVSLASVWCIYGGWVGAVGGRVGPARAGGHSGGCLGA